MATMYRPETRISTTFTKMSFHCTFYLNLIITLFILMTKTINSSPAPPFPPIMTSHTESFDLGQTKMLPAGTYPNYAAAALAAATFNDTELNSNKPHDLVKRSWEKLHGSWGKRNNYDKNNNYGRNNYDRNYDIDYNSNMENFIAANNILSESKEDDFIDDGTNNPDYQDFLKYSEIYRWSPQNVINNLLEQEPLNPVKRGWKNMNAAWGKRRSNNDWNKFRGSWGKREAGWNSLKGMWGKRSGDWNKLQAAWGKRSLYNDDMN